MNVFQFVHTLNYGDAISGEAIAIQRLLSQTGIGGGIYSVHAHEKVKHLTKHYSSFNRGTETTKITESDILILHHSIASPLNELYLQADHLRRVLIYHNLTPVKWFIGYNQRVVEDLHRGRDELPQLLAATDIILADSEFNKEELLAAGAKAVDVLPLLLDQEKWKVPANTGIARVLRSRGEKNILHVGRLAPNKRLEDVIKAFYFYHHKIERNSKLWLIGIDIDTEIYSFELRRLVSELRLKEAVSFVGAVADSELRSFYENSDLYLCLSEHEGFCLPLTEAMYFGLPIIAYDCSAVGGTIGQGGILLREKDPVVTAELIDIVLKDAKLRSELIDEGRRQVERFQEVHFERVLLSKISMLQSVADQSPKRAQGGR